jgi:hypothetical protein
MKQLFNDNTLILKEYFNKYSINKNIKDSNIVENSEIIYTLNENEDCNIILMGDNHGSFHSFFRIILRLYIKGIIKTNYILKENYDGLGSGFVNFLIYEKGQLNFQKAFLWPTQEPRPLARAQPVR